MALKVWKIGRNEMVIREKVEIEKVIREGLVKTSTQEVIQNALLVMKGLIPKEVTKNKIIGKYKDEVIEILRKFIVNVYKKIWTEGVNCKVINEWERQSGITKKMKEEEKLKMVPIV
jgi:hypothetical protein